MTRMSALRHLHFESHKALEENGYIGWEGDVGGVGFGVWGVSAWRFWVPGLFGPQGLKRLPVWRIVSSGILTKQTLELPDAGRVHGALLIV